MLCHIYLHVFFLKLLSCLFSLSLSLLSICVSVSGFFQGSSTTPPHSTPNDNRLPSSSSSFSPPPFSSSLLDYQDTNCCQHLCMYTALPPPPPRHGNTRDSCRVGWGGWILFYFSCGRSFKKYIVRVDACFSTVALYYIINGFLIKRETSFATLPLLFLLISTTHPPTPKIDHEQLLWSCHYVNQDLKPEGELRDDQVGSDMAKRRGRNPL